MANKEYIERLHMVITQLHECDALHTESVPVHEVFQGQTAWEGVVEVFELIVHPIVQTLLCVDVWRARAVYHGVRDTARSGRTERRQGRRSIPDQEGTEKLRPDAKKKV